MGAEREQKGGVVTGQLYTAITKSYPNRPHAATAATIRGWAGGIVKFSEDCWGGLAVRGHQATKAASGKLSKAHITQPPAYFTSIAAELSSLPTMLINWLFCQSKHSWASTPLLQAILSSLGGGTRV